MAAALSEKCDLQAKVWTSSSDLKSNNRNGSGDDDNAENENEVWNNDDENGGGVRRSCQHGSWRDPEAEATATQFVEVEKAENGGWKVGENLTNIFF
jgi:hypothetical protein